MTALLELREKIKNIYGKYDVYLKPLLKFILGLCVFLLINGNIGYMGRLSSLPATLALSLACAILPLNGMIWLAFVVTLLHLYSLSLEVAAVALALFLLLGFLYFRFAPKDSVYAVLTPVCLHFQIGAVMPMAVGLTGKAYSVLSVICGTIVWFFLDGVKQNAAALGASGEVSASSKFAAALAPIMSNKEMYLVIAAFFIVTVTVLLIRRLSIDYAWTVAIIVGGLAHFILLFAGYILLRIEGKTAGLVVGSLVSLAAALVLEFLFFNLDYSRTERVQFEDDEYYYYVKAVPKMIVAERDKRVKTFASKGGRPSSRKQLPQDLD